MLSKEARTRLNQLDFKIYQPGRTNGVSKYAVLEDGIVLAFHQSPNTYYLYDYIKPGRPYVRTMIKHAEDQQGLNTYVNKKVNTGYAGRWMFEPVENPNNDQ